MSEFTLRLTSHYDLLMAFLMLNKHRGLILRVFDRCQDEKMLRHPEVARALQNVYELHERFRELLNPTLDAMIQEEVDEQH